MLETERLALRELADADAAFIVDLLNQPSWLRFIGERGVRTDEDAIRYMHNGPMASYQRLGFGLYLVLNRLDGAPMGLCGLLKRDVFEDVDIGFAFLPQYWGSGYAHEAALAVMADARERLALKRLVAVANPDNERSIHLLKKLGFVYEKRVKLEESGPELSFFLCNL